MDVSLTVSEGMPHANALEQISIQIQPWLLWIHFSSLHICTKHLLWLWELLSSLVMKDFFFFLSSTVWGNTSDSIMRLLPHAAIVSVMCYFFFRMIPISLPGEVEVTWLHGPCYVQTSLSQNKWFPPKCQGGFEEVSLLPLKGQCVTYQVFSAI